MLLFEKKERQPKPYLLRHQKGNFFVQINVFWLSNLISEGVFGTNSFFRQGRANLINFSGEPYWRDFPVKRISTLRFLFFAGKPSNSTFVAESRIMSNIY